MTSVPIAPPGSLDSSQGHEGQRLLDSMPNSGVWVVLYFYGAKRKTYITWYNMYIYIYNHIIYIYRNDMFQTFVHLDFQQKPCVFFISTWGRNCQQNTLTPCIISFHNRTPRHRRQHSHTYQRRQREFPEWAWITATYRAVAFVVVKFCIWSSSFSQFAESMVKNLKG